ITPMDNDLRAFVALGSMNARKLPEFDAWLRQQQPLFKTKLFQEAGLCPPPLLEPLPPAAPDNPGRLPTPTQDKPAQSRAQPASPQSRTGAPAEKPKSSPVSTPKPAESERLIPIGRRYERDTLGE